MQPDHVANEPLREPESNAMSNRPKTMAVNALMRFREECKEEGLSLECAIATLAIQAAHLDRALEDDSFNRVKSCLGSVRYQFKNTIKALKAEYPDMNWSAYEQGKKKARPKASPPIQRSVEDGETNSSAPGIVWSDGNGSQQEAPEPTHVADTQRRG